MPFIRQEDIVDGTMNKDLVDTYKINPGNELHGATTADPYALGFGLGPTSPLQIKETDPGSNINWTDEQDISFHNQVYAESNSPFYGVSGNVFKSTTVTIPVSNGNLVGIWGGPGVWTDLGAASALNTNRYGHGASGSQNAKALVGGYNAAANRISSTEIFNGLSFTTSTNLNVSKAEGISIGSYFAMLYGAGIDGGGNYVTTTSFFNGSSWTANVNVPAAFATAGSIGLGSFHAGYLRGGVNSGGTYIGGHYNFNGSVWAAAPGLSAPVGFLAAYVASAGSHNNAVMVGGLDDTGNYLSVSFTWNGTVYTAGTNLNISASKSSVSGVGTSAILNGGYNGVAVTITQLYNGHMWVSAANSSISKSFHTSGGSAINFTTHGNENTAAPNRCEAFNQSTYRKIVPENINTAGNLGVFFNKDVVAANRCSIKVSGFIKGLSADTAGNYIVLKNNSLDAGTNYNYQVSTPKPCSEDYLIGKYDSVNTKLHVFSNLPKPYNVLKRWG